METYLFKFSACLLVFWLVYVLFLERQTMHRFKRFYLLGAFATALIIPQLTITKYIEAVTTNLETAPIFIPIEMSSFTEILVEQSPIIDLETALWLVYGLGAFLFLIRFTVNLFKINRLISSNKNITKRSFIYVLLKEYRIPHSFFKYIFLNKLKFENNDIPEEVILHEETHAKQLHSLDIVIIELLQIVFWFHPLLYILKHHIKLNHEFLADQAVIKQGTDTSSYQKILLQFSSNTQNQQLASAINYSSIKKRFTVMKTQTSKIRIWVSSLLLLPIIAILFYSFAEREYVEKESIETSEIILIQNNTKNEGATEAMMKEYNDWMKKLNNDSSSLIIPVGTWERLVAIYDLMNEAQRNSVEMHPFLQEITPDLYNVKPNSPSTDQFESWKNEKKFAIWLDGKHVSNSVLNKLSKDDIAHYVGSKVHKNAQSEKFPQPFQFNLYTKEGFNKFYKEAYVNGYKEICNEYSIAIQDYLKGSQTDNFELRILKAQADKFYNQFTKEELKKYSILPTQAVPAAKQKDPIKTLKTNKNKDIILLEHWYITIDNNKYYYPYKKGDLKKYYDKYGNEVDLDIVKEYLKKHKNFEALKSTGKHYVYKSKEDQKEIEGLFSDLGGMYFRMPKINKAKVKRPISPVKPYIKITLSGKTYYKKYEELTAEEKATLPPPPPPATKKSKGGPNIGDIQDIYNPSFLEYIIEMEAEGASFYLDDEKISAKKAKSIANNGKRTEMITQKDANGNYLVKLSSAEKNKIYARSIDLKILNDNSYSIDGVNATKRTFVDVFNQLHQDITPEVRNKVMNIHVNSSKEISNKEVWFIYNSLQDYGFYRIVTDNQVINRAKGNKPFAVESLSSAQQKATPEQVAEYNKLAKHCNTQLKSDFPIIKVKEVKRIEYLYGKMSEDQKKNAESYPDFSKLPPPPPPPPEKQERPTVREIAEYDVWAKKMNIAIKKAEATHTKTKEYPIIKKKDYDKYYKIYSTLMTEAQRENAEPWPNIPPPPPAPESTLDFVIRMAKANAKFFNERKSITSDEAIALIKKNDKLNINAKEKGADGKPLVYITKKPIIIDVKEKSKN